MSRFKDESRKFASACQAEHRAVGEILAAIDAGSMEADVIAALRSAHLAVDVQLGYTMKARYGARKGAVVTREALGE